jgi:DnaK suppressor protein
MAMSTQPNQRSNDTTTENTLRYSDSDLQEFRKVIEASMNETLEEIRMVKERIEDLSSYDFSSETMVYSMHMAEQGSEALEKEKAYTHMQRLNEYMQKLEDALDRINDKTYGVCKHCNCLIAKERLLAVPITTQSASWKLQKQCPEDGIDRVMPIQK